VNFKLKRIMIHASIEYDFSALMWVGWCAVRPPDGIMIATLNCATSATGACRFLANTCEALNADTMSTSYTNYLHGVEVAHLISTNTTVAGEGNKKLLHFLSPGGCGKLPAGVLTIEDVTLDVLNKECKTHSSSGKATDEGWDIVRQETPIYY
jgi:hypothetical protein